MKARRCNVCGADDVPLYDVPGQRPCCARCADGLEDEVDARADDADDREPGRPVLQATGLVPRIDPRRGPDMQAVRRRLGLPALAPVEALNDPEGRAA